MIPPAPTDLWDRVIAKIAQLVFERETTLGAGQAARLQGPGLERRPGTIPTPVESQIGGAARSNAE